MDNMILVIQAVGMVMLYLIAWFLFLYAINYLLIDRYDKRREYKGYNERKENKEYDNR